MRGNDDGRRRPRAGTIVAIGAATLTVAAVATASATTLAWGADLRDGGRLLPGTTIASVAVGDATPDEAVSALSAHVDDLLDRPVTVAHHEHVYRTTPRALGATADVAAAVAEAAAHAEQVGFTDLVRLRWLGAPGRVTADVPIELPADAVTAFVDAIGDELDRGPIDAEVAWVDDAVVRTADARAGRELDRDATATAVTTALLGDGADVTLPFDQLTPALPDDVADEVATAVTSAVDARLDRPVTVTLAGADHTVTARDLDAVPDVTGALAAALADAGVTTTGNGDDGVPLTVPDAALAGFLDRVTAGTVIAPVDARLDVAGGGFRVTPHTDGAAVDRAAAATAVRAAVDGDDDAVALTLDPVRPTVTTADLDEVLVVRQSDRTVELVRGGATVASWPVAVGTGGSPTPTGTFVVGAMRYEPTWVNPARDRWGADMPERIGPGPDNPLGARAINWNTLGGGDTLIRFHGTPNEASIGSASSNGCVRMFNADVIELYGMIGSGTPIVSVA